jgi:Flp pilus assembly protein TadG
MRSRCDRGSVTAETALALPVLVVVLALAIWVLAAAGAQLRCVEAASGAARAAARGETDAAVTSLADRLAPDGAVVRVEHRGEQVHVHVTAEVRPFRSISVLPPLRVQAQSVAMVEPGVRP